MKSPSRKTTNKRLSTKSHRHQQQLLEVTLRASTERLRRFRQVISFVGKAILIVGICAGSWYGGKEGLRKFLWENPDYAVHEINFNPDGALTREQVLTAAHLKEGVNIFSVDIGGARAEIEKMPQVESAVVQRVLPNRINVTVTERRPIAWVVAKGDVDPTSSDRSFLIDARGIVLRSRVLLTEYYNLPKISGFETGNLVPGKRVNVLEMQAALELIRLNADSTRFQVLNIDVSKGYCLIVTDQLHAKITFGLDRLDVQLSRLYRCLDRAAQDHKELQTVNLLVERNVPVTFYDPDAPEEVPTARPPTSTPGNEARPATPRPNEFHRPDPVTPRPFLRTTPPAHTTPAAQPWKKPFRPNQ